MPEKILREIRIWSKVSESQYLVQYNTSWTENIDDNIERMNQDKARKSTSESNSTIDVSPLSGHILYIQMELCRMTLKDAITKINDELNQRIGLQMTIIGAFIATQLTDEIANGVHYLHSSSPPIIHRDLKPENIFITDGRGGNYIKIGDLGLATFHCGNDDDSSEESKKPEHVNEHTCGRGTKEYMAPEVRYSTEYNEKSDAYSLGCIMAELFCIEKSKFDNTVPW
jgi:serine/threonine protein kinase